MSQVKLMQLHHLATEVLKASLLPGQRDSLKARSGGTVLDGHQRLYVLRERGEDIDRLPRQIIEKRL